MGNFFFIKPALTALEEGRSVRFGIFILMWVIAIAIVIGGIVQWIDSWNFVSGQDAAGVIGVIIFQLIFLLLLYFIFQILVIRASDVLNVEAFDNEFTVIPVMSVLARTVGELLAVVWIFLGIGGLIVFWFSGYAPYSTDFGLFGVLGGSGFKGGVLALVAGIVQAFVTIVIAYFWAEVIILGLKWYLHMKKVRQIADGYEKPAPVGATAGPEGPKPEGKGGEEKKE